MILSLESRLSLRYIKWVQKTLIIMKLLWRKRRENKIVKQTREVWNDRLHKRAAFGMSDYIREQRLLLRTLSIISPILDVTLEPLCITLKQIKGKKVNTLISHIK